LEQVSSLLGTMSFVSGTPYSHNGLDHAATQKQCIAERIKVVSLAENRMEPYFETQLMNVFLTSCASVRHKELT
jgi:hypothetical protein